MHNEHEFQVDESPQCRYCLSTDNTDDLVSPCACSGSIQYIHKQCLIQWWTKKQDQIIVPGWISQFNPVCELCGMKYNIKYEKGDLSNPEITQHADMKWMLFKYILYITVSLLFSYICM